MPLADVKQNPNVKGGDILKSLNLNDLTESARFCPSGICGRCAACGYAVTNEEAVTVSETGDLIHRACWEDYAADNAQEFFVAADF